MGDIDIPLSQIRLHNCLHLLGITILFYDHAITFDDEYWRIWKHSRTGAALLFYINRYFALLANIVVGAGNFISFRTEESCLKYAFYRQMMLIITQIIVGVNQFLRTYALYGRDRRIALLILCVSAFLLSISIWAVTGQKSSVSLVDGCHLAASHPTAVRIAVAWEALFTFDVLIFAMTLLKTWRQRFHYAPGVRNDLVALMLRDGAIYFGVMAIAQCANTLTFYLLQPALRGVLSTFASSISVSMMSRLMLNLHRSASDNKHNYSVTTQPSSVNSTTMLFTSRLGLSSSQAAGTTLAATTTAATSAAAAAADCEKGLESGPVPPIEEECEIVEIRRTD